MDDFERRTYINLEKYLVSALVDKTPVKTSFTQGSWRIEYKGNMKFKLINDSDALNFLEYGTKPHEIRAKTRKFLKFKKPITPAKNYKKLPGNQAFEKDGFIFAKKVWHPGTEALHFVKDTLDDEKLWAKIFGDLGL